MKITPWEVVSSKISDAYLAGFLDGDGSIVAVISKQDIKRYPNKPLRIILKVNFAQHMRHERILIAIQKYLSGVGSVRNVPSHNLSELVIVKRNDVEGILKRLLPHLILKQHQAKIALKMINVFRNCRRVKKNAIAPESFAKLIAMAMEIRKLNSRTGGKKMHSELTNPVTTQV